MADSLIDFDAVATRGREASRSIRVVWPAYLRTSGRPTPSGWKVAYSVRQEHRPPSRGRSGRFKLG